jgi:DNA recombination protein RmuC
MSQEAALLLIAVGLLMAVLAVLLLRRPGVDRGLLGQVQALAAAQDRQGERLTALMLDQTRALGEALTGQTERVSRTAQEIQQRLAVIDAARANMEALGSQVHSLAGILGNKQARGAFGETQLEDLVRDRLPAEAFAFQHTCSNGRRADCLIRLPYPPGPIVVDSKFPLEAYRALHAAMTEPARVAAGRQFAADVTKHVKDVAARYILPGETADGALIFVPSEAIFCELHANHPAVVAEAARRNVYIVSPSTMWAVLGTMRALLKDIRLRAEAGRIKVEMARLVADVKRLEERLRRLKGHFTAAQDDLREVEISAEKIIRTGARVEAAEAEEEVAA